MAALNGDFGDTILKLFAKPSETPNFIATGSRDPDQDALRFAWWFYPEAGRKPYGLELPIASATSESIRVVVSSTTISCYDWGGRLVQGMLRRRPHEYNQCPA